MPVVSRWKAIGEGLRLSLGTLEQIDSHNPRDCMSAVLKHWLRRNYDIEAFGEPTWRTVVKVVAHSAAGNNCALALSITGRHSGNRLLYQMIPCQHVLGTEVQKCLSINILSWIQIFEIKVEL